VDDEIPVRVLHRGGDKREEIEPLRHRRAMFLAPSGDREPLDVLHREERASVVRRAAIQEPRDVGMLEPGEDLPLAEEAGHGLIRVEAAFQELDRDGLLELTVDARGEIDTPHAAATDLRVEAIGTDAGPGEVRSGRQVVRRGPVIGIDAERVRREGPRGTPPPWRPHGGWHPPARGDRDRPAEPLERLGSGRLLEVEHLLEHRVDPRKTRAIDLLEPEAHGRTSAGGAGLVP
jgi:hypothetical protein